MEYLAEVSSGDARIALSALELAAITTELQENGIIKITLPIMEECVQKKAIKFA